MSGEQLTTTRGMTSEEIAHAIRRGRLDDYIDAAEQWGAARRRAAKRQPNRERAAHLARRFKP